MSQQGSAPARPLYDHIEGIRIRRGWSKIRVAREAGIDRGTLENWKKQPRSPTAEAVKAVAEALGIDQELALTLAGILPRGGAGQLAALSDEELRARLDELGSELARRRGKEEGGGEEERRDIV